MSHKTSHELTTMEPEDRYDYALEQLLEHKTVWVLVNDQQQFVQMHYEQGEFSYLPIWPSKELAEHSIDGQADLTVKNIALSSFMQDVTPELTQNKIELGVFPGEDTSVWVCEAEDFKDELQDALDQN